MKSRLKLPLIAIIVTGLLILLLAGIHTPPVENYTLAKLSGYLRSGADMDLTVDSFHYNLLTLSAELNGLTLRSTAPGNPPPFLTAASVKIGVSLFSILKKKPVVDYARIQDLQVQIITDSQGNDNLPHPPPSVETAGSGDLPGLPLPVLVKDLKVQKGSFLYADEGQGFEMKLQRWILAITGNPAAWSQSVHFETEQAGQVEFKTHLLPVNKLKLGVVLAPGSLKMTEFNLEFGESRVKANGTVNSFDPPEVKSKVTADLNIGRLLGFLGMARETGGHLAIEASVTGPPAGMKITSLIKGENLFYRDLHDGKVSITARWREDSGDIEIDSLEIASPQGSISGKASLGLLKKDGRNSSSLRIENIDLGILTGYFLPIRIASRADGNIAIKWPGTALEQADAEVNLRLRDSRSVPARYILPFAGKVSAKIQGGNLKARIVSGRALHMEVEGDFSLASREMAGGQIQVRTEDMAPFIRDLEAFLGRAAGSLVDFDLSGPLNIDAQLSGKLDRVQIAGTAEAADTVIAGISGVAIEANVQYTPERLVFQNIKAARGNQVMEAYGAIGFGEETNRLDMRAKIENGTLETALEEIGKDWAIRGEYFLDATLGGTTESLDLSVSASLSGLHAYGQDLGRLEIAATMRGDLIELERFELDQKSREESEGRWTASGRYNRKTGEYEFRTAADGVLLDLSEKAFAGIPASGGVLNLKASGHGSVDDPTIDGEIKLNDLNLGGRELGELVVEGSLKGKQADIETRLSRYGLSAEAIIDILSPYPTRFEAEIDTDLSDSDIRLPDGKQVGGRIEAEITGSGDLAAWEQGTVSFRAEDLELILQGLKIQNRDTVVLHYGNRRLDIRSMNMEAGNSEISLNGSLPLDSGSHSGAMKVEGRLDLSDLSPLLQIEDTYAMGILHLDGTLNGTLREPEPNLNLTMSEGGVEHPALRTGLKEISMDVSLSPDTATIRSFSAQLGQATIRGSGVIPLNVLAGNFKAEADGKTVPAGFSADVENLQIGDFNAFPDSIDGTAGFHLEATLPDMGDLQSAEARATFGQFRIRMGNYVLEQQGDSRFSINNGTLTLDHFSLTSPTTTLNATGSIGLTGDRDLDIRADGDFNIGIASLLARNVSAEGDSRYELNLSGSLKTPKVSGFFEMKEGSFSIPTPSVSATGLQVRVKFNGQSLDIEKFSGSLNGGVLEIQGTTGFGASGTHDTDIGISLENAFLEYPEGLRSRLSGNLTLRSEEEFLVLGGQVRILDSSYRRRLDIVQELLGRLKSDKSVHFTGGENPFLSRLRFNLNVATRNGILIDNNLAELTLNADVRLTGNYYATGLVGRVTLEEGGQLRFHERKYLVQRGVISLTNETGIEPSLDIQAATRVESYDITLNLTGTPDDLKANLASDPSLSQPDIIALLLTGRELEDLQGSGLNVAREQVESYLSGRLAGFLSQNLEEAVGLSLVRIDPSLISPEANPGARLTVGDEITGSLFLVYSMNLSDAGDRILTIEYDITRNFQAAITRQSDNSYRFGLGQDLHFGGSSEPSEREETRKLYIGTIDFTGQPVFEQKLLLDKIGLKGGKKYDFFKTRKGLDRLRDFYRDRGYIENRIRLGQSESGNAVNLTLRIDPGPVVEIIYKGWDPPKDEKDKVLSIWSNGVFQEHRIQTGTRELRQSLSGKGYLQAEILSSVHDSSPDKKTITFSINPGIRFENVETEFGGAFGIAPSRLKTVLKDERLLGKIHTDPETVIDFLIRFYRQSGFLDVSVQEPKYELNPEEKTGKVIIPIQEGPRFRIRELSINGNEALTRGRILEAIRLSMDAEYDPEALKAGVDRLEKIYWTLGFNNVRINYSLKRSDEETDALNILLEISENRQQYIREIAIEGNRATSERMIRSQLTLKTDEVLDYTKTNESRRNLYRTNAFTLVDIQSLPFSGPRLPDDAGRQPVQIKVLVKEVQPFRIRYSGFYDTERGVGGIVDFSNRNSLGSARLLGTRLRYDSDVQEARMYFSQPILHRFPINTDITGYFRKEAVSDEESTNYGFNTDTIGVSLQQEVNFRNKFILNYGYRFEHKKELDFGPDPPIETVQNTAPLTITLTRESRNNVLDSWNGSFTSLSFEYAPFFLGSDLRYYKFLGQYFHYLPLSRPTNIPWVGTTRSRLVFASGVRIGFAGGIDDQDLISANKFFAGGSTTVRGFGQNRLGPKGPAGNPIGGNSIFIVNGELRFPLLSIFDGVGFMDLGNVYPYAEDFDPTDIRTVAGFGLRARTPYFLLRADYGFKLDREPDESSGKFFFSIGQAF